MAFKLPLHDRGGLMRGISAYAHFDDLDLRQGHSGDAWGGEAGVVGARGGNGGGGCGQK